METFAIQTLVVMVRSVSTSLSDGTSIASVQKAGKDAPAVSQSTSATTRTAGVWNNFV